MKNNKNGFLKFLAGAGIGIGVGMLFSKRSGKENRELLKNKIDDLVIKAKEIDSDEVKNNIQKKVDAIIEEISEMDKEKALNIAKKQAKEIKNKTEDLVEYVVLKGTPVLEKAASSIKEKAIIVTKEILNKLEQEEK